MLDKLSRNVGYIAEKNAEGCCIFESVTYVKKQMLHSGLFCTTGKKNLHHNFVTLVLIVEKKCWRFWKKLIHTKRFCYMIGRMRFVYLNDGSGGS
jgi:hypothetical protein